MRQRPDDRHVLRIVMMYAVCAAAWIFFSDNLLRFVADPDAIVVLAQYKGIFFVAITSILLYVVLNRVPPAAVRHPAEERVRVGQVAAAAAVAGMIGVIAVMVYRAEAETLRRTTLDRLEHLTAARADLAAKLVQERQRDVVLSASVLPAKAGIGAADLAGLRHAEAFSGLAVMDPQGRILASRGAAPEMSTSLTEAAARVLRIAEPHIVYRADAGGAPLLTILAPVAAADGQLPDLVLAADWPIEAELVPLVAGFNRRPASGERFALLRVTEGRAEILGDSFLPMSTAATASSLQDGGSAAIHARTGERRIAGTSADGEPVLAAVASLPIAGWRILGEIDEAHAFGHLRHLAIAAGVSVAIVFGAALVLALFLWQRQQMLAAFALLAQQRRVQAAEDRYQATIEQVPAGILHVDAGGRILRANRAFLALSGYTAEAVAGLSAAGLLHPDDLDTSRGMMERLVAGQIADMQTERRFVKADGAEIVVLISSCVSEDPESGEPIVIAVISDVTARRRTEDALRASEERFDLAMRGTDDGIWDWTIETGEVYYSPRWKAMLGFRPGEIENRIESREALIHPADVAEVRRAWREALDRGQDSLVGEFRMRTRSGGWRHILSRAFIVHAPDGQPVRVVGTHVDITEHKAAEVELRRAAAVFSSTQEAVVITDPDGLIQSTNPAFTTITGWTRDEAVGGTMRIVTSGLHDNAFYQEMWRAISDEGQWQGEIWNRRRNGELYPEWLTVSSIRDEAGTVTHRIATFSDIGRLRSSEARLAHLANHDSLTDLPNRLMLADVLDRAVTQSAHSGGEGAVLFLDLDRFKTVNDSLGHAAGDELIVQVAQRLSLALPDDGVLARLGGDEFVAVVPNTGGREAVASLATRWGDLLSRGYELKSGRTLYISGSIGIALFPEDGTSADTLLQNADAALYEAKGAGGSTHRFYTESLTKAASEKLALESGLRRALDRAEFALHYQPIVSVATGKILGVEALLRWTDPETGPVDPACFIPVAEETGLILQIGEWVLPTACRQMAEWRAMGLDLAFVAVNLSAREFQRTDIVDRIRRALDVSRLPAENLEIEITEGVLFEHGPEAARRLTELRQIGVKLAVDDFGTGYSSLAYLSRLPLNQLKIDRSFVQGLPEDQTAGEIARTVVALGQTLGLQVLAEGVETAVQLEELRSMGCDLAQGYYFSRPVPARDIPFLIPVTVASGDGTDRDEGRMNTRSVA